MDDVLQPNGTLINWDTVAPGTEYVYSLKVVNAGTAPCTVILLLGTLPLGWVETWAGNNTLLNPSGSVEGDLTLSVPVSAVAGTYNFDSWIGAQ